MRFLKNIVNGHVAELGYAPDPAPPARLEDLSPEILNLLKPTIIEIQIPVQQSHHALACKTQLRSNTAELFKPAPTSELNREAINYINSSRKLRK